MKEQLHEAWRTNNKIDMLFVELIGDEDMTKTLSIRGGRTVYEQLVHMHNLRLQWLDMAAKEIAEKYKPFSKNSPCNKELLFESF